MKKTPPPKLKHNTLAAGLGISRSYASRLIKQGMPDTSVEQARKWIEARAAEGGAITAAATLAEQRKEKLRLECALLALRLQRESDGVEFLPVDQVTGGIRGFLKFAMIAMKFRADENAEALSATTTPQQAYAITKRMLLESWATGICAMLGQIELDKRIVNSIRKLVSEEFVGMSENDIDAWIAAVNGNAVARP